MNLPHHRRYNWRLAFKHNRHLIIAIACAIIASICGLLYIELASAQEVIADKRAVIKQFDQVVEGKAVMRGDGWKIERVKQYPLIGE